MKKIFDAVIGLDHVYGAAIIDADGRSVYDPLNLNKFSGQQPQELWNQLTQSGNFKRELDLVFEKGRLYIRKIDPNYLLVFMDTKGSVASLKLTCDLIEPQPTKPKPRKKFLNLF
ncbi:MAG: hypothetical protein HUN04_25955 [Desulfobacter sp.]|nr:MAG: hypothetical protein HUN04_25955 [Desulfobacter sp.]